MKRLKELLPSSWRKTAKALPYRGTRYACPYCGVTFRQMRPDGLDIPVMREKQIIGGGYRRNAKCPYCSSTDRERLLLLYLQHKTELLKPTQDTAVRLLHIAPEPRLQPIFSNQPHIDYLTADLLDPTVMVKMDITDIQYEDETFDVVICNHVMEHIPDDLKAMREIHRVLKQDGWAILQTPLSANLEETYEDESITTAEGRLQAFGQEDHVRIYAAHDYPQRLTHAGFRIEPFDWLDHEAFGGDLNYYCLIEGETLFIAYKS